MEEKVDRGWTARGGTGRREGPPETIARNEATESLHSREASGSAETGGTMSSSGTGGMSSTVPTSVAVSERGRAGYGGAGWSRERPAGNRQEEEEQEKVVLRLPEMEQLIASGPRFSVGTILQEMTTAAQQKIDEVCCLRLSS